MISKGLIIATLLASLSLPALSQAHETYTCKGAITGLHFAIYTNGNTPRGGHMYIKSIQTATLSVYRMNKYTIRAKVKGNTAKTEFILNKSRKAIYITLNGRTTKVCNAKVGIVR